MDKQALEARAAALQTELDKLRAEIAKPALLEGFTAFEPTEKNSPPCHPRDTVDIILRSGTQNFSRKEAQAYRWDLQTGLSSNYDIVAYKVVQKYVEPRLMKYSELPVGQVFARSAKSKSRPSSGYVYLKIRHERMPGNALVIKKGGSGGVRVGDSLTFNDGNMKYYAVTMEYNWGELLVVPSEKK